MKHVSRRTAGDGGAYSPSRRGAGQVLKKTGRDRQTPSPAVQPQDGRTAPLRTLVEIVKLLLERDDVNPDKPSRYGETPLWWAAHNGHGEVAEILLKRDGVDPHRQHRYGETPLQQAARNGHEEVVKILLGQGVVSPGKPDERGETLG